MNRAGGIAAATAVACVLLGCSSPAVQGPARSDAWVHDQTTAAGQGLLASPRPSSSAGGWPG